MKGIVATAEQYDDLKALRKQYDSDDFDPDGAELRWNIDYVLAEFDFKETAKVFEKTGYQWASASAKNKVPNIDEIFESAQNLLIQAARGAKRDNCKYFCGSGRLEAMCTKKGRLKLKFVPISSETADEMPF